MSTPATQPASLARQPATAVLGYGLGDFANNLAFSMSTSFLLLYYTDVAGLAPAAIATMFLVVRLWDAFADLFAGRMVDRTQTRWGRFRPFLLWVAIPVLFLSFMCFNVPSKGVKWLGIIPWDVTDSGFKLLYAYLTYAVFGLVYSLINIPYGSLASAMTQSVNERAKLVSARAFGSAFGGLFLTYLIAPQVNSVKALAPVQAGTTPTGRVITAEQAQATWQKLGAVDYAGAALEYQQRLQDVFTTTTLAFVVLGTICYWLTFLWCRETVVRPAGKPTTIRETLETLKNNTALQILCGAAFFYLIGLFAVGGSTAFYAQYVLGSISHMPTIALVNSGVSLLITPLIPAIIARLGKKTVFQYCGLFTVVGGMGLWFVPTVNPAVPESVGLSLTLALILLGIKGVGASLINTVMFGLGADTVEYGEWKTGKRTEGATYSIFSFTRKITQSIGGAVGGFMLELGGYLSGTALARAGGVQPQTAVDAIKFTIGPIPAICAILAMLAFMRYPLTDRLFDQIREENEARKVARAAASGTLG